MLQLYWLLSCCCLIFLLLVSFDIISRLLLFLSGGKFNMGLLNSVLFNLYFFGCWLLLLNDSNWLLFVFLITVGFQGRLLLLLKLRFNLGRSVLFLFVDLGFYLLG